MSFELSLIIPNHNHADKLPRLLDSVLAQRDICLETVIVDDCSDQPYGELLDGYRSKGLAIRFLEHRTRLYTKDARLTGIRAAAAPFIAFADADDILVGTETLARHARQIREEEADVLHFRSLLSTETSALQQYNQIADPFAERLEGDQVFRAFLATPIEGIALWNKIFRKEIFAGLHDRALQSKVLRYAEDGYLCSLYMMHARRYIGSSAVGYAYHYVEKIREEGAERAAYTYLTRQELLPYIRELGFAEDVIAAYTAWLEHYISLCVGKLALAVGKEEGADISDATVRKLLEHTDAETLIKVLLLGNRLNAEKIVGTVRLLRTGKPG